MSSDSRNRKSHVDKLNPPLTALISVG